MNLSVDEKVSFSIMRRLTFCAGHRVHGHESKCKHPHGHNYVVYVTARPAKYLDSIGRVIDFSVLKAKLGTWLDEKWDHAFIYWRGDEEMSAVYAGHQEWKHYVMPTNPTAENMAAYLLKVICPELFGGCGISITNIVVEETENCTAEVSV